MAREIKTALCGLATLMQHPSGDHWRSYHVRLKAARPEPHHVRQVGRDVRVIRLLGQPSPSPINKLMAKDHCVHDECAFTSVIRGAFVKSASVRQLEHGAIILCFGIPNVP